VGRRWVVRAKAAFAAITLAALTVVGATTTTTPASAAQQSTITAPPSAAGGATITITGTVFDWPRTCQLEFDSVAVAHSSCLVTKDQLAGSLTVPTNAAPGQSHLVTACPETCLRSKIKASTTIAVPPLTPPVLVAVPSVVGMSLAAAETALHRVQLLAGYPTVPANPHVTAQQIAAGTLVPLQTRIPLALVGWVQVPDLTKLTLAQANATVRPALAISSTARKGRVKTETPARDAIVPPGTVIYVTLADPRNYLPIIVTGSATVVVLVALLAAARAFMQRRRRLARRWYYDHVRLASRPTFEVGFDDSGSTEIPLPSVRLAVRDTRLQTCELEEAVVP
jgi:hypothetical protein